MGTARIQQLRRFPALFALTFLMAGADVPPPSDASSPPPGATDSTAATANAAAPPEAPAEPKPAPAVAPSPAPAEPQAAAKPQEAVVLSTAETLRVETVARLAALPKPDDKEAKPSDKSMREIFEARLKLLDAYEKAVEDRKELEHPKTNPEDEAVELKAELDRLKPSVDAAAKDLNSLIPATLQNLPASIPDDKRDEIRETIESAEGEYKEASAKYEEASGAALANKEETVVSLRAGREKLLQKIETLKAKVAEREKAVVDAPSSDARDQSREKLVNAQWEVSIEVERLKGAEISIGLSSQRAHLKQLNLQVLDLRAKLSAKTLDALKKLHQNIAIRQEQSLQLAANREKKRADKEDHPLEKYRAKRTSELLELQARILFDESVLTTDPPPTFEEQHTLTLHCEADLKSVKHLLDDGRISHLDALRLNNDFRRIGAERERIEKNELARSEARLTAAEITLSRVEQGMAFDSRDDRFELENILERLPKSDHPKMMDLFAAFEKRHLELLNQRQVVLEKIAARAEETHEEVLKRLRILDDHFGFIRTHIFWVRDEEPISSLTFIQANREFILIARGAFRLVAEFADRSLWGRISAEFVAASLGLIILPWPLIRLSKRFHSFEAVPSLPAAPTVSEEH